MTELRNYLIFALALVLCCRAVPACFPPKKELDSIISVEIDGNIEEYTLEKYIQGVLNAELPPSFHLEAMKAQAVAARTYATKTAQSNKHESFDICASSQCCQGFDPSNLDESNLTKSYLAALETKGEVLSYDDCLIDAAYFACSGGKTEDASAVWGYHFPYLISLDSPGEECSEYYDKSFSFTKEQLETLLSIPQEKNLSVSDIYYTPGNGIDTAVICGICFTGTELRKKLDLPSTYMDIFIEDNILIVHTKGYGHRVGMSQTGAQSMAESGADYRQILIFYYPNSEIITTNLYNKS